MGRRCTGFVPYTAVVAVPLAVGPRCLMRIRLRHRTVRGAVALEELLLTVVLQHLPTADEDVLHGGRQFERVAGPDDDVGVLSDLQGAELVGHAPDPGGVHGDG